MVWMFCRIGINATMTLQPFYLVNVTLFKPAEGMPTAPQIAIVPLGSFLVQLIFSLTLQRPMTACLRSRFLPMVVAIIFVTGGSVPLYFLDGNRDTNWVIYPLAALQGVGLAIMLNTATSLISDVIGNDTGSSAFVYGMYSLFEKCFGGLLMYFLVATYSSDGPALRIIQAVLPTACSVLSFVFTWIGHRFFSHKMAKLTGL